MRVRVTHRRESDGRFLGYLNDHSDYWTQGDTLEDLKEHLMDLYDLFSDETIPGIRHVSELEIESA